MREDSPLPPYELPPPPNQLKAMAAHFSQLLPALIFLNVTVVVVVLTSNFPKMHAFLVLNNQLIIATLSIISAFLFYRGTQRSYFAQSNNIAELEPEARRFLFNGIDPFDYLEDQRWKHIVEGYTKEARTHLDKAVLYLELGTIMLFVSISYLLLSYAYFLGIVSFILTFIYIVRTIRGYRKLRGV